MSSGSITRAFIDKIISVDYDALPLEAITMAKQVAIDGLAVMLAGSTEPSGVGRISTAYVRGLGGVPQASVIAGGFKTSMENAAYVNGTIGHALDFDNMDYPPNHPVSPTLPAILAVAEHHKISGKKVIEAIVTALEAQSRIRLAAKGMELGIGFHKNATVGMFGAIAAVTKLLNLDADRAIMAFGLVGSRACGLSSNTGSMTKSSHSGHAARMGIEAGVLAKMGWTAGSEVFGPKGFFDTFMPNCSEPELLVKDFGNPFRMVEPGLAFKKYPCNNYNQRPIDAALMLRTEHHIKADQIDHIGIVYPRFEHTNRPNPRSGLDGKFSAQYSTLVALLDGEVTVNSYTDERLASPDVAGLLPKTELLVDDSIPVEFPHTYTIVKVRLKNGKKYEQRIDKLSGFVGYPLTAEQMDKKFYSCATRVLKRDQATQMLNLLEQLDKLSVVTSILDIARC